MSPISPTNVKSFSDSLCFPDFTIAFPVSKDTLLMARARTRRPQDAICALCFDKNSTKSSVIGDEGHWLRNENPLESPGSRY